MIHNMKVLALIPARGGSKGVPRKNIRSIGGKPLIAWSIEAAKKSQYIDKLIVSTEDEEIASVSRDYGVEVLTRPLELAQDDTPAMDVIIHALRNIRGYSYIVLLQPTSPLRTVEDIDRCLEICITKKAPSCVSLCEADKSPYWMYTLNGRLELVPFVKSEQPFVRRQDIPKVYALNGAVYAAKTEWLIRTMSFLTEETLSYMMPKERSMDIDTPFDFEFVDFVLQKQNRDA